MTCRPRSRTAAVWPVVQTITHHVNQQVNRDSLRVGDAERDEAARALGDHFAAGRLDREEYDERLERAFAARVGSDLRALFADLPQPRAAAVPSAVERAPGHHGNHGPFLPVLFVLIGAAILFSAGWIVWLGLGLLLFAKKVQWERRRRQRSAGRAWA